MSGGVFICYRREESAFAARAIHDRVVQRLDRENVFLDFDNIDLGVDWFDVLSKRVGACDALVAVIGRNWTSISDKDSQRRLDDPDDFVRIEIEAALKRDVRVIPVLVDGADMPKAAELPDSLKGLARRQGIEVSPARFDADVEKLTRALASILEGRRSRDAAEAEAARRVDDERRPWEAAKLFNGEGEKRERVDAANAQRISHEEEKARGAKTAQNAEWIRGIAEANAARRTDKERLAGGAGHVAREGAELAPSVPVVARRETDEAAVKADITLRLAEAGRKAEGEHRAREVERAAHEERQRAMSASSSWNPYKEIQTTFRGHPVRVKNTLTRCVLYIDGEEVDRSKGLVSRDKNAPVLGGTINIDNIFHFVEVYAFSEALKVKIKLCIDGEFVTGDYF